METRIEGRRHFRRRHLRIAFVRVWSDDARKPPARLAGRICRRTNRAAILSARAAAARKEVRMVRQAARWRHGLELVHDQLFAEPADRGTQRSRAALRLRDPSAIER